MKKILRLLLAAALMLSLWSSAAHAAGAPMVRISSGEVAPGGNITLTISIEGNPGLAATLLYIYYDTSVFTVDTEEITGAGAFRSSGMMVPNTIALAKENGRYFGDPERDGVLVVWVNSRGTNISENGDMFTLKFQTADTAPKGVYEVGLGYSERDTGNEKMEHISLNVVAGAITITDGAESFSGNNASETTPSDESEPSSDPTHLEKNDTKINPSQGDNSSSETTYPNEISPDNRPSNPAQTQPDSTNTLAPESTEPNPEEAAPKFEDAVGHWAEEWIVQAAEHGLIQGYEDGLYWPDDTMTRAQLVTILWRAKGSPAPRGEASFTDLPLTWYREAIAWAEETGVVNGIGDGTFKPEGDVTREQLAAILYRMAGSPTGMEAMLTAVYDDQYKDSGSISAWAKQPLYWTLYHDIYCGQGTLQCGTKLAPGDAADRAQIAVMMVRYLDKNG